MLATWGILLGASPAGGQYLAPAFDICPDQGHQGEFTVAADPVNNRFLIAWLEPVTEQVFARIVSADGSAVGTTLQLSSLAGSNLLWSSNRQFAAFSSVAERYLVVWQHLDGCCFRTYGQLVAADASLVGGNFAVSPLPVPDYYSDDPAVTYNAASAKFIVAWDGGGPEELGDVRAQMVDSDGTLSGSVINVTSALDDRSAFVPYLAVDSGSGRFLVLWETPGEGLYRRLFAASGLPLTMEQLVWPDAYNHFAVFDPVRSRFLVSPDCNVARFLSAAGELLGSEFPLTRDPAVYTSAVAYDATADRFVVSYESAYAYGVFGQVLDPDGGFYGRPFTVDVDAQGTSLIAYNSAAASSMIVWSENGTCRLHGRLARVVPPPDFDADEDVDSTDFEHLEFCATGPAAGPPEAGCEDADLDGDGSVDQADFAIFQRCINGISGPADLDCIH